MLRNWKPVDFIIATLTITISSYLILALLAHLFGAKALNETQSDGLLSFLVSILNIIAMYVGAHIQANRDSLSKPPISPILPNSKKPDQSVDTPD